MGDESARRELEQRSGLRLAGVLSFGDSPALADELLRCVADGPKRATAGPATVAGPLPAPGQRWGVLDGAGRPRLVIEVVQVRRGRLDSVDPAFAWDEGEDDRTLESWLDTHRRFYRRLGIADPDACDTVFERFRVVWPDPDVPLVLSRAPVAGDPTPSEVTVRELRWDERDWVAESLRAHWGATRMVTRGTLIEATDLPGVVAERDGERVGLITFRPRPGGSTELVTVNAFLQGRGVGRALLDAVAELGRRTGWRRVWLITTNDNTRALRFYQRAGFELVALHHRALEQSRRLKPEIPEVGEDGIPLLSELELERRLAPD